MLHLCLKIVRSHTCACYDDLATLATGDNTCKATLVLLKRLLSHNAYHQELALLGIKRCMRINGREGLLRHGLTVGLQICCWRAGATSSRVWRASRSFRKA